MGGGELFKSRTCSSEAEFIFPVLCDILLSRTEDAARKVRMKDEVAMEFPSDSSGSQPRRWIM